MPNWKAKLGNWGLGIGLNSAFRVGYSPKTLRRNFEFLSGASAEALKKRYRHSQYEPIKIGRIQTEIISASPNYSRTILFLHGGGYFMGSISTYRRNALRVSYECQAKVVVPEYRLAPEFPFPHGLEDAIAAYQFLLGSVSPSSLFIAGDSAGGGLALALMSIIQEQNLPKPRGIFCLSPWTDLTGDAESIETNAHNDVWLSRAHLEAWAPWYLGSSERSGKHPGKDSDYFGINDRKNPLISPVFADFTNFPPLLIFVGDQEVLLSDSVQVAKMARNAGVKVYLEVGIGMQHDWFFSLPGLKESRIAFQKLKEFVEECLLT